MVERVVVGPWKTNCYIFSSSKKECIIIDPGGDEEEIASRVDVLNMVPIGIALTHGHVDHLAALGRLQSSYASRGYSLPIAINPADRRFLGIGALEAHTESRKVHAPDELAFFAADASELPKADVKLREGDRVFDMDLVVVETPGHTPGSVCFYSEKEGVLFSGDTLFFDGVGRTDLPGASEKKLRESIEKKIAILPPETRVFPGHGPFTTVERERRGNPFFRLSPPEPKPPEPFPRRLAPVAQKSPVKKQPSRPKTIRPSKPVRTRARASAKAARRTIGKPKSVQAKARKVHVSAVKSVARNGSRIKPAARASARASARVKSTARNGSRKKTARVVVRRARVPARGKSAGKKKGR
ncbi:MAG TPA: MBL fold metallo-hydrolase [Spirochaetia bacterium]|nr:MBL fold metallo-hydrolase [Spirochaetia bacterium]